MNKHVLNAFKVAALLAVVVWLWSLAADKYYQHQYGRYEARVIAFAQRKEIEADSLKEIADSLSSERDSLAAALTEKVVRVRDRVQTLPPAVTPSDTMRDQIIAAQDSIITDLQSALVQSREIEAALRGALKASEARGDSLYAFIQKPKPKPSRWSLGAGAGMCVGLNGTQAYNGPCVMLGVTYKVM